MKWIGLLVSCLALFLLSFGLAPSSFGSQRRERTELKLFDQRFDLTRDDELERLSEYCSQLIELSIQQEQEQKEREKQLLSRPREELSFGELRSLYGELADVIDGKERRGLEEIRRLAGKRQDTELLHEIADAVANNDRSPMPRRIELSFAPIYLCEFLYRPVGIGRKPAANLGRYDVSDLSLVDPLAGTFWRRPSNISAQNLYAGFGRSELPKWETCLWTYTGPKTSFGAIPGIELSCNGARIKAKFGETVSEPFAARIFASLGFYVDSADRAAYLKIKYDRRFFREFHMRRDATTRLDRFGLRVMSVRLQHRYDPFEFVAEAVFRDGSRCSGRELKKRLLRGPDVLNPEDVPGNFRPEVEKELDWLITIPANVQAEDNEVKSIGPWDFNRLGHEDRRELRGVALLAAWLGWCDARFDNNRLKVVRDTGEFRHYFSDLGGGLGKATGFVSRKWESPRHLTSSFTRPAEVRPPSDISLPFRIVNYTPVEDNAAFAAMTVDDARWMARLIAQLTETQLAQALQASGAKGEDFNLYLEKLINRRNKMIQDLELDREIAPLRPIFPSVVGRRPSNKPSGHAHRFR